MTKNLQKKFSRNYVKLRNLKDYGIDDGLQGFDKFMGE